MINYFTLLLFIEFIMASIVNQSQINTGFFDIKDGKDKKSSFVFASMDK